MKDEHSKRHFPSIYSISYANDQGLLSRAADKELLLLFMMRSTNVLWLNVNQAIMIMQFIPLKNSLQTIVILAIVLFF